MLDRSLSENNLSHNRRGGVQDQELFIRLDLARGRLRSALERCDRLLRELESRGDGWHAEELQVFAARALGWLERPLEAAERLSGTGPAAALQLESEERPALWALAGLRTQAVECARSIGP